MYYTNVKILCYAMFTTKNEATPHLHMVPSSRSDILLPPLMGFEAICILKRAGFVTAGHYSLH